MKINHSSLEHFEKDMELISESIRLAYGPWTKKEKIIMNIVDAFHLIMAVIIVAAFITGVVTLFLGLISQ